MTKQLINQPHVFQVGQATITRISDWKRYKFLLKTEILRLLKQHLVVTTQA